MRQYRPEVDAYRILRRIPIPGQLPNTLEERIPMIRRSLAVFVPIVLLVACSPASSGEQSQGGAASAGASSPAGESTAPGGSAAASVGGGGGDGLATVDLTITGGDYAGTYHVEITGQGGCSTGATGPGSFSVASITVDPAEAFQGPQLTLYDADAASAPGGDSAEFSAAFPFNNYAYTVEVNPKLTASQGSNYGSGTATLDNRGSTATLTIEGTTSATEQVQATIECHTVATF